MLQGISVIESLSQFLVPALTGGLTAVVAMWIQRRTRTRETTEKVQIQYLNPLLIATSDFRERLEDLDVRIQRDDRLLFDTMNDLKNHVRRDLEYIKWANGF